MCPAVVGTEIIGVELSGGSFLDAGCGCAVSAVAAAVEIAVDMMAAAAIRRVSSLSSRCSLWPSIHLSRAFAILCLDSPPSLRGPLPPCHFQPLSVLVARIVIILSPSRRTVMDLDNVMAGVGWAARSAAAVSVAPSCEVGWEKGSSIWERAGWSTAMSSAGTVGNAGGKVGGWWSEGAVLLAVWQLVRG